MKADVRLRAMTAGDLPAVVELERELFPEDPWSPGMFADELSAQPELRHYVVAEAADGSIAGYAGLSAAGGEGDVQTIGVRPEREGQGIGSALLTDLLTEAAARDCAAVFLEVRADNPRAQGLYERFGFDRIGLRRRYYQPSGVDAVVMRKIMEGVTGG